MAKLKPREFITPERVREIKSEIKALERQISGGDDNSSMGVGFMQHAVSQVSNPEDIQREISKKKRHLEDGTPKPFETVAMKNSAYNWAKKAERWIKENAPQGKDVFIKYPKPGVEEHDFDRSVKRMTNWMQKGNKVMSQYRYIMRRLDPKNPDAGKLRGI